MTTHAHYNVIAKKPYTWCGLQKTAQTNFDSTDCKVCKQTIDGEQDFSIQKTDEWKVTRIRQSYYEKLSLIAKRDKRSVANMLEVLIDTHGTEDLI